MADKTTTLKTKTNDNVYPNVIGDNRKNAFVDSSTITHHFYDQTHKVGFQIANETNIKIQNSLQKPTGLTKTKLVGVGTNGQENIEIGDNLTLANGKLSAIGGGSGGEQIGVITVGKWYTLDEWMAILNKGLISVSDLYAVHSGENIYTLPFMYEDENPDNKILHINELIGSMKYDDNIENVRIAGEIKTFDIYASKLYNHFITITNSISTFYFTYQNTSEDKLNTLDSLKTALKGKCLLCTGHTDSEIAEYISGEGANIVVGVVDKSDNSTSGITIDSSFTITDLVSPVR